MTAKIIPIRKPVRDVHGEALDAALALDRRPFTSAEARLNADLARHLENEFARDPEFARRAEDSM